MRDISNTHRLIYCFPIVLASAVLVTGCKSSRAESETEYRGAPAPPMATTSGAASGSSMVSTSATSDVVIPLHEEQLAVGTRKVESGAVRLRKHVTTEPVTQNVQIRRETLVVDREAAPSGAAASSAAAVPGEAGKPSGSLATPFEPGEIVIQLHNEEPVVETRVVPAGRIIAQTRTSMEQTNVQREVRRENINVERIGNAENVIISENVSQPARGAVGAAPAERQQIQGQGQQRQEQLRGQEQRVPATREEEGEPFPRPQPNGHMTFPELHKDSEGP